MAVLWTDSAVSVLLEALQSRESLWNTNVPEYKNRDKKKTEYDELLVLLKDELPTVNLAALKGKIQSLRTSYREEVRKQKKSKTTGSGSSDVYVPKWKFYDQCKFLEDVVLSNRAIVSNISPTPDTSVFDTSSNDNKENMAEGSSVLPVVTQDKKLDQHPTKKRRVAWMETAANALNELAKGATTEQEDEWGTFGKDVANSIRALGSAHLQRKAKFAVQQALFHVSDVPNCVTHVFSNQAKQYGQMVGESDTVNYQPLQTLRFEDY